MLERNLMKTKGLSRKILLTVLALILVAGLYGCGSSKEESKELKDVTLVLDWTPNTNHTGIYVAIEKGYFEEEGLNVKVVQPPEDGAEALVASGKAEFGISFQDTMAPMLVGENKLPITAVAAILQHNTSGIISLKDKGIDSPKKMENHSYATWDLPVEKAMIKNIVEKDGGNFDNVKLIPSTVEDEVSALQTNTVDSLWVYYGWAGVKTKEAGLDTNYFSFKDINPVFDYYTPVVIANNEFLEKDLDEAKAFLKALKKGYEFAAENPSEAAEILLKHAPELDKNLVIASQDYLSKEYISDGKYWGYIDQTRWNNFYNWLNDNNLVETKIPENTGFTNDYLTEK